MSRQKEAGSDDHEFWRLVIESQVASGLSVNKFCENEGISPSSFYQWRKKLEQKSDSTSTHDDDMINEAVSSVKPGFIPLGQIHSDLKDLCIAFPNGIQVNASGSCDVRLLCETVRVLCEQRC